jgi:hypothetical protein
MTDQVRRLYSLQENGLLSDRTPAFVCCVDRCLPHHSDKPLNCQVVATAEAGEDFLRRHKGCRTFVQWSGARRK